MGLGAKSELPAAGVVAPTDALELEAAGVSTRGVAEAAAVDKGAPPIAAPKGKGR